MPFNDYDLKRLKDNFRTEETWYMDLTSEQMEDILARLEAAERYGKAMRKGREGWYGAKYEAWRKAKG